MSEDKRNIQIEKDIDFLLENPGTTLGSREIYYFYHDVGAGATWELVEALLEPPSEEEKK